MDDDDKYENALKRLISYISQNNLYNTYVVDRYNDNELSIIIRNKKKIKDILSHLGPSHKIKHESNETCSICFENYKINESYRNLPICKHIFHKKCIDKWFKKNLGNMNCPICKTNYDKKIIINS